MDDTETLIQFECLSLLFAEVKKTRQGRIELSLGMSREQIEVLREVLDSKILLFKRKEKKRA